jgi:hypothetical protein
MMKKKQNAKLGVCGMKKCGDQVRKRREGREGK